MTQTTQTSEARDYIVQGMTCSHCVLSVREEVSEVAGVDSVDVDLASGRMTVRGEDVSDDAVRAAVAEAGYQVTGSAEPMAHGATTSDAPAISSPRHTTEVP